VLKLREIILTITLTTLATLLCSIDIEKSYSTSLNSDGNSDASNTPASESYVLITKWGSQGEGEGQFSGLNDVIVVNDNSVFVPDYENHRIQKFTGEGQFITKCGSSRSGDGQFLEPEGIDVDSQGRVYVADTGNNRIQVFAQGPLL
jgi:DNA-binding beta-propeller fold protein YncE